MLSKCLHYSTQIFKKLVRRFHSLIIAIPQPILHKLVILPFMYSKYVSIYVYINFVYIHSVQVVSEICRKSIKISGSSYKNLILSERKLLQFPTQNRHLVVSIQHTYTHTRIHLYQHVHKGAARPSSTHTHTPHGHT